MELQVQRLAGFDNGAAGNATPIDGKIPNDTHSLLIARKRNEQGDYETRRTTDNHTSPFESVKIA